MNGLCGTAPFPLPPSDTESGPASQADSNREKNKDYTTKNEYLS